MYVKPIWTISTGETFTFKVLMWHWRHVSVIYKWMALYAFMWVCIGICILFTILFAKLKLGYLHSAFIWSSDKQPLLLIRGLDCLSPCQHRMRFIKKKKENQTDAEDPSFRQSRKPLLRATAQSGFGTTEPSAPARTAYALCLAYYLVFVLEW